MDFDYILASAEINLARVSDKIWTICPSETHAGFKTKMIIQTAVTKVIKNPVFRSACFFPWIIMCNTGWHLSCLVVNHYGLRFSRSSCKGSVQVSFSGFRPSCQSHTLLNGCFASIRTTLAWVWTSLWAQKHIFSITIITFSKSWEWTSGHLY